MRSMPALTVLAVCLAAVSMRSQNVVTYDFDVKDVYGNPMRAPAIETERSGNGERSYVSTGNLNGSRVKLESVTEKVHKVNDRTRVIERTVQRYDPNGNPAGLQRERVTEVKNADGAVDMTVEKFASDANGNMSPTEKQDIHQRQTSPNTVESDTIVSRPDINGGFGVAERAHEEKTSSGKGKWTDTKSIYRQGQNGFYEANKVVTQHDEQDRRTTDVTAEYEIGSSGSLELHSQTSEQKVSSPDGSSVSSIDYFNRHAPGYAVTSDQQLALRAREIREHKIEAANRAVDVLSVQHPSLTDPTRLDAPKVVSETVCNGSCK